VTVVAGVVFFGGGHSFFFISLLALIHY